MDSGIATVQPDTSFEAIVQKEPRATAYFVQHIFKEYTNPVAQEQEKQPRTSWQRKHPRTTKENRVAKVSAVPSVQPFGEATTNNQVDNSSREASYETTNNNQKSIIGVRLSLKNQK